MLSMTSMTAGYATVRRAQYWFVRLLATSRVIQYATSFIYTILGSFFLTNEYDHLLLALAEALQIYVFPNNALIFSSIARL